MRMKIITSNMIYFIESAKVTGTIDKNEIKPLTPSPNPPNPPKHPADYSQQGVLGERWLHQQSIK